MQTFLCVSLDIKRRKKFNQLSKSIIMFKIFVLLVVFLSFDVLTNATCCPSMKIDEHDLNSPTASAFCALTTYPKKDIRYYGYCQNGEPIYEGFFCGSDPCNIFGCNCTCGCNLRTRFVNYTTCAAIIKRKDAIILDLMYNFY